MSAAWDGLREDERERVRRDAAGGDALAALVLDAEGWFRGAEAAEAIRRGLAKDGAVVARAARAGNRPVVFVRDRNVTAHPAWARHAVFDMEELRALRPMGDADLVRLLDAKEATRGRVMAEGRGGTGR